MKFPTSTIPTFFSLSHIVVQCVLVSFGYDSVYTIRKRCFGILHTAALLYVVDVCDDDRLAGCFHRPWVP